MNARAASIQRPAWMAYALAVATTSATLWARVGFGFKAGEPPMMILFLFPIMLSVYVGGLGPGLLATALAALGSDYYLMPPIHSFAINGVNGVQWVGLIVVGSLLSLVMESLHRSRLARDPGETAARLLSTERKVQAGFALALASLGVIAFVAYLSVADLRRNAASVGHTHEVIAELRQLLSTVTDAETAQRGFSITGEEEYLEPYTTAANRIDAALQGLRRLTADNSAQQGQLELLAPFVAERMAVLREIIERQRSEGFAAAQAAIKSGIGKELHDRIRELIAGMEKTERGLLLDREERARSSSLIAKTVIVGGGALAFVFVAVALFFIREDFAGSRRAEAALREARDRLEGRVMERTAELERQRAELQLILDSVPALIFFKDLDHRVVRANLELARLLGRPREEIEGRTDAELDSTEAERYVRDEEEVIATGEPKRYLIEPLMTRTGQRWLRTDKIPQRDASGRIVGVIGFAVDITERKLAEEENARLAAIVESSDDAIIGKTLEGIITSWNRGAENLFGYSAEEAVGRPMLMLFPPERAGEGQEILTRIARGESVDHFETVRLRKDGEPIDISATVSPLRDGAGRIVGASKIARDITARKRAETALARLNAELEQRVIDRTAQLEAANRELESFSYSVSHDLRAPLRGIAGFSQALDESCGERLDETERGYLARVRAATERMGQLIDDLLNLARVTRSEMVRQPVDLSGLARSVVDELRSRIPARAVEIEIEDGMSVEGDPRLLRAMLENLLGNAWKFTGKKECAHIAFRCTKSETRNATFAISDDGSGFDMRYAGKLFGAFQRLHTLTEFPGTGIGLATVQRIIHRHGGQIWAEAAVDDGATFFFELPISGPTISTA